MKKLFLLDGMALAYRAHFAFAVKPIFTSKGLNTSAIYGFANTLIDLIKNRQPTHLAVVFDTEAPTQRHVDFAEYKAQRQAMPEDLSIALPHIHRLLQAFRVPVITLDGYEADDIIGTLARRAEPNGFDTYMVTPDKDFGQLVTDHIFIYKPSRMGDGVEILGAPEVLQKWNIRHVGQVIDLLALWGDASDNIPGVPGIGEKTAQKLIAEFGSVENLLANTASLKGKLKESLETNRAQAELSKKLATILCDVPVEIELDQLAVQPPDPEALGALFVEFEFNSLGRRLFGEDFKAGRGGGRPAPTSAGPDELDLGFGSSPADAPTGAEAAPPVRADLKTVADVPHQYEIVDTPEARAALIKKLMAQPSVCFDLETTALDCKVCAIVGLSLSWKAHEGFYVPFPSELAEARALLEIFRPFFESDAIEKVGHNIKFDLGVLAWQGIESVRGKIFDTMLAHSLIEPDQRHGLDYLAEVYLNYAPIPITRLIGDKKATQINMRDVPLAAIAEYAAEDADIAWQLRAILAPLLAEKKAERVFYEIECPLAPVLVDMEKEGVTIDCAALAEFSSQLGSAIRALEKKIYEAAGTPFNLNSPKQLGDVLFNLLKLEPGAKKTKTGQYATDEQTLLALSHRHPIVRDILEFREATKLKSTYVDALPHAVVASTGRIHTTYNQAMTATGRLNSNDPNLQNIPIRSEQGREIRKAFVPRGPGYALLAADYSQIELRIIASLSGDAAMLEAFAGNEDIHRATAAKVYGVAPADVGDDMRRNAKMVNFGIAYGISAFGLAQRLGLPRSEAAAIINAYFTQYPGIKDYMNSTIEFARENGYVETVTGRRRYLRDIRSANAAVRSGAERNAINSPIQGTAADMIKIAMVNIWRELEKRKLRTKMILQVHDELVFELWLEEKEIVLPLVEHEMKQAIPNLKAPIVVELGIGRTWLEAH